MLKPERIAELLAPYLDGEELEGRLSKISVYIDILIRWNQRVNLTAVREPEEIVRRHFGESLFAARLLLKPEAPGGAIDVGSGAGFPGMVFGLYAPRLRLTLIESRAKKATFLREVVRTLGLSWVSVVDQRAETFAGQAELVSFRAVEQFQKILPVCARLVLPGGQLAALIGSGQLDEAKGTVPGEWTVTPIPESNSRVVAVLRIPEAPVEAPGR